MSSDPLAPATTASEDQQHELELLFRACLNPSLGVSDQEIAHAAKELGVEPEVIAAVSKVESPRGPFDTLGRPSILFERHYFHRLTSGAFDEKAPGISAKTAGGYGKYAAQYDRLEAAYKLSSTAALMSTSWGRFQIMGSNFKAAGYASPEHMVQSMMRSEAEQLRAFVRFVGSDKLMVKALKDHDWAEFAKRYNGPGYAKKDYDTKLKRAYEQLTSQRTSSSSKKQPLPTRRPKP